MLNSNQQEAVLHKDGPLLINAGAGSGKTHTVIERIIHLITKEGVRPEEIFAVTFTNKAAKDMKERITKRIQEENIGGTPTLGTFHGLAARFLRTYGTRLGYEEGFTIYDTSDSERLIKQIMKDEVIDDEIIDAKTLKEKIEQAKNFNISPSQLKENIKKDRDKLIADFYEEYNKRLMENNAMDFNDLLVNFYAILNLPDVLDRFTNQYKYFFVDEYQDTNTIQYKIINKLAAKSRNLCVIGDDYQSIYSFRYANMQNILNFNKDYPDAKVINLEENYRSTQNVVNGANGVIKHNTIRLDKNVYSRKEEGEKIMVCDLFSGYKESDFVAKEIKSLGNIKGCAVLYRNNYLSRGIEEALIKNKIPYRIFGGLAFVERMEIKDIMGYINIISNPKDSNAFKRIINTPTRGLGAKAVSTIVDGVKASFKGDFISAINDTNTISKLLPKKGGEGFADFCKIMKEIIDSSYSLPIDELISKIIYDIGYYDYLEKNYDEDDFEDKKGNLGELISMATAYSDLPGYDAVIEFSEQISLMTDVNEHKSELEDYVSLMSIHKSKGLEFENVFMIGVEDGIIPSKNSMEKLSDIEEERRLMYVAMTRAKKRLYITHVNERMLFGKTTDQFRSRFIKEIPAENMMRL